MKRYSQEQIEELAQILKNDGVISVPTDTVYGLCSRMYSKNAREKIMHIKERPSSKSLPIMCADEEQIKSIAIVGEREEKIINSFMPGPITLVLLKGPNLPEYVNEGSVEIGIRMATSEPLKRLIKELGEPICMTSANKSGKPACTTSEEVEKVFPELDGIMVGNVIFGESSTIVDCTSNELKIQREGPISIEQIKEVL